MALVTLTYLSDEYWNAYLCDSSHKGKSTGVKTTRAGNSTRVTNPLTEELII